MSSEIGPKTIRDGLVFAVDAADQGSYVSGSITWNDLSGNRFNGTLNGGVGYSNTGFGSMVLDGVDDRITSPSVNTMGGIPNQTLEIWIKSSGLGITQSRGGLICPDYGQLSHISNSPTTGSVFYGLYFTSTSDPINVSLTTAGVNCFDNIWHHITCTRNSADAVIYVDGISRASGSGGGAWSGSNVHSNMNVEIGNNPNNFYYRLMGNIGLARIYNKALSASEVVQNYNAGRSRFGLS